MILLCWNMVWLSVLVLSRWLVSIILNNVSHILFMLLCSDWAVIFILNWWIGHPPSLNIIPMHHNCNHQPTQVSLIRSKVTISLQASTHQALHPNDTVYEGAEPIEELLAQLTLICVILCCRSRDHVSGWSKLDKWNTLDSGQHKIQGVHENIHFCTLNEKSLINDLNLCLNPAVEKYFFSILIS